MTHDERGTLVGGVAALLLIALVLDVLWLVPMLALVVAFVLVEVRVWRERRRRRRLLPPD